MEIRPHTLETLGYHDYNKAIKGPFTAHPKIDPKTGELIFFGYSVGGFASALTSYGAISPSGVVTRFEQFHAPYASMVHDFIVTERHVLFPILPLTASMERASTGKPPYAWEPDKSSYVGLMCRNGSTSGITWFRGEACYVYHVMNDWEEGNQLIADVMQSEEAPLFPNANGSPKDHDTARARLCRWTFNLTGSTDSVSENFAN
jgi:carotenoid cleavage dioxygenase-like enzyme